MEENFDLGLFLNDGEPIKQPEEAIQGGIEKIKIELAFHEASHFVFDLLIEKMNIGFASVTAIKIDSKDAKGNYVDGCLSPYPGKSKDDFEALKERRNWYSENRDRFHVKLLSVLAGYTSYQVFIEDTEYFINPGIEVASFSQTGYKKISDLIPFETKNRPTDFETLFQMLIYNRDWSEKRLREIQAIIKLIMANPSVSTAIGFVKNYLIKNEGREISGIELQVLKKETRRQLKRVSFKPYLELL